MGSVAGIYMQDPGSGCWKEEWVSQRGGVGGAWVITGGMLADYSQLTNQKIVRL